MGLLPCRKNAIGKGKMLQSLSLENFRNFGYAQLEFSSGVNVIFGPNGVGKTNLLEAAYVCGFGNSFRGRRQQFVRMGEEFARVVGTGEDRTKVEVVFTAHGEKRVVLNGKRLPRLSELLGKFPISYVGPHQILVVAGMPQTRRFFVDSHRCQYDPEYTRSLYEYRRSLRQRNAALRGISSGTVAGGMVLLEAWDDKLISAGVEVIRGRIDFLRRLEPIAQDIFAAISDGALPTLRLVYKSTVTDDPEGQELAQEFRRKLAERRKYELEHLETTVGPHRDDVEILLGELPARSFASWGQMRMISLALYLSAARLLGERTGRVPTLLLDDAFAELDPKAAKAAMKILPQIGQAIVATPHPEQVEVAEGAKKFILRSAGEIEQES